MKVPSSAVCRFFATALLKYNDYYEEDWKQVSPKRKKMEGKSFSDIPSQFFEEFSLPPPSRMTFLESSVTLLRTYRKLFSSVQAPEN